MFAKLSVVVGLAALINAAPAPVKHVLHEARDVASRDWVKGARIEKDAIIPMRIGLTQTNLEKGYDYLMEVSHPDSENYGKHWTAEQVHDAFAPEEETVANIKEWLTDFGIHGGRIVHSENKGWIAVDVTVEEAESLLLTEFHEHEHKLTSKIRVGCDKYHVPEHLQSHIDYITPGIKLIPVKKRTIKREVKAKRESHAVKAPIHVDASADTTISVAAAALPPSLQNCSTAMTPTCIQALYGIPSTNAAVEGNSLGLYQQGSYFSESDVNLFFANWASYIPQNTFPINASIDGGSYSVPADSPLNSGEADIDIEMSTSLIYPQTVVLYQTDDDIYEPQEVATTNLFNTFLDALDGSYCTYTADGETGDDPAIDPLYPDPAPGGYKGTLECGIYKPTNVISASYGQAEADLPSPYVLRQCNEFMKLGLQGHSILFASGDYGVTSFPGDGSASGCLGPDQLIFNPQYPSGCPYVTSVGGSQLAPNGTVYDPEVVMADNLGGTAVNFSSSGGFSNYFARPTYQDGHVETYFHRAHITYPYYSELDVNVNTTTGIYNRIGRAYPDVSANGAHFPAYIDGELFHFYGSSLASPLFASVITLLNQERATAGKGPIGFINPTLYRNDDVLNDITAGTNFGCGTQGFHAVEGWDPATGLGTPNYPKMKALFLSLP
ncbi:subtilisin-like protein [Mollisia scopiformis]|uniref:Subtilisin-like protein n=1 Tax=Mollisia scopiformis TaxID=149040 RepID=A0A194WVC0_MOLSC|nr:subtilisin-like protein [Mollisia scopiformis]KUJ11542.1 subtilisin-like protein [Mollisia scopiformis]